MDKFLLGREFPADVRLYPILAQLPQVESWKQVRDYVLDVRQSGSYAAEVYTLCLSDTSGKLSYLLVGSIPEAKEGVTGGHTWCVYLLINDGS